MTTNINRTNSVYIAIIVIMAIIIVILAFNNQGIRKEMAGGTLSKLPMRYYKMMSPVDITLRKDISSDETNLIRSIKDLLDYNVFEKTMSQSLEAVTNDLKAKSGSQKPSENDLKALEDYRQYILDNSQTVSRTITLLMEFYSKDTSEVSVQVEKNLLAFKEYVDKLLQKDAAASKYASNLDNRINETDEYMDRKAQLNKLRAVSDRFSMKGLGPKQ